MVCVLRNDYSDAKIEHLATNKIQDFSYSGYAVLKSNLRVNLCVLWGRGRGFRTVLKLSRKERLVMYIMYTSSTFPNSQNTPQTSTVWLRFCALQILQSADTITPFSLPIVHPVRSE